MGRSRVGVIVRFMHTGGSGGNGKEPGGGTLSPLTGFTETVSQIHFTVMQGQNGGMEL